MEKMFLALIKTDEIWRILQEGLKDGRVEKLETIKEAFYAGSMSAFSTMDNQAKIKMS